MRGPDGVAVRATRSLRRRRGSARARSRGDGRGCERRRRCPDADAERDRERDRRSAGIKPSRRPSRSRSGASRGPAWPRRRARRAAGRRSPSGRGTVTRTTTSGSGDPGQLAAGSTDQPVAPFSTISTVPPVWISTWPARPAAVPRSRYSSTARATIARRRVLVPALVERDPDPAGEPGEEVVGRERRIEVRVEVVERAEDRRERPRRARRATAGRSRRPGRAPAAPAPAGGACRARRRSRASGALDQDLVLVAEHERVRSRARAAGVCWPRSPVTGSAPNSRASSTSSVPRMPWSTE